MALLPQDTIFCSVHFVWHITLFKPLDNWFWWNVILTSLIPLPKYYFRQSHYVLWWC